ncbi:MAG: hypothetical protein ACO3RB_05880 [Ilumatobacteraceae bacterium]|jgi:hypothetical protein
MGQPVAVERKSGGSPAVVRFETNRSLTGQGHERYRSAAEAKGTKSGAVVARRLLESGQVAWVHVYGNVVTAELSAGASQAGLDEIVRDLYQYWKPGMTPPSVEELLAQMPAEAAPAAAASGDGGASGGGLDPRVPAHLWERSQAALARWRAKNG